MPQLHAVVEIPRRGRTTYAFDTFPVRIGRSDDNQLIIAHECVPRDLCTAWLETDGKTVRVEERPGLRNPLVCGKSRVQGGISASRLQLRVGPVRLILSSEEERAPSGTRKRTGFVVAAAGTAAMLMIVAMGGPPPKADHKAALFEVLPKSPLCATPKVQCNTPAQCAERARLLPARATEMLSRRSLSLVDRVRAVTMLGEAAAAAKNGIARPVNSIFLEASRAESALNNQFQQEIMRLRTALINKDSKTIREAAASLRDALYGCDPEIRTRLDRLVKTNREEVVAQ